MLGVVRGSWLSVNENDVRRIIVIIRRCLDDSAVFTYSRVYKKQSEKHNWLTPQME